MKIIDNPICPHCEEEITFERVINVSYDDEGVYVKAHGECLECGKKYSWTEYYEFSHIGELNERKI